MENAAQVLHRLTSYASFDEEHGWDPPVDDPRVLRDLVVNDLSRFPWFFKRYSQPLTRVPLPRDLPPTTAPAIAVLAGTAEVRPGELDVAQLSRLLYLSAGVVRTGERPHGQFLFRAAGSAGGRFPLELYVAVPEGMAVPAGVHWYDPLDHALVEVGPPPRGDAPALIVTGVPWRTGWRYRERGYRHMYWDAGTMLAQSMAVADSAGLTARLYSDFPDAAVAALVGADGVHELPVAVVALGGGEPALDVSGPAAQGEVDAAPVEFPLVTAAQRAGDSDALGQPWERGAPVELPAEDAAPGLYRWPDLAVPVRSVAMRDELYRVCLDQALARDAAFVVIAADEIGVLDARRYREAQLAAGLVEGRLHLAAYALQASATGMTFIDAAMPGLLGEPLDGLLLTCVGVPEYKAAAGGQPGAPVFVRTMPPRE